MVEQNHLSTRYKRIRGVLFDIDGTLCFSDPVHFEVFRDLFMEIGFNDGKPIDEEFFRTKIAGRQNALICAELFPDWSAQKGEEWSAFKEQKFRERAVGKLQALPGLEGIMDFIDSQHMKKAAVTNAPRANAEFMLSVLNRRSWFTELIIGALTVGVLSSHSPEKLLSVGCHLVVHDYDDPHLWSLLHSMVESPVPG